jgi:hypothetical protein
VDPLDRRLQCRLCCDIIVEGIRPAANFPKHELATADNAVTVLLRIVMIGVRDDDHQLRHINELLRA